MMQLPPMDEASRQWLHKQAWLMLGLAAIFLGIFENFPVDIALSGYFYEAASHSFPLQHHWLLSKVMHSGLKTASYIFGIASLIFCVYAWRKGGFRLQRPQLLLAALGVVLIPLLTTVLKSLTNRHCPWDIIEFGGYAPYVSLFNLTSPELQRGVCFPAGHASAGFVWLIWAVALRASYPALARKALVLGLAAGLLMGFGRMVQGAHFLSHVLWSGWFAWSFSLLLAAVLRIPLVPARQD